MKVLSWLIGVISAFCIVAAVSLYAENWYLQQEIKALKDDTEIAWRNYRDLEAEIAKCRKANAALKAAK